MGMLRTKIKWTVPGAGTAYSVFHWLNNPDGAATQADADDAVLKTGNYAQALRSWLPGQVTLLVQSDVEEINEQTGNLIGVFATAAQAPRPGSGATATSWAAAVGGVITWTTAGIRKNRRVRGRSFVVPLSSLAFANDGTLSDAAVTGLNDAANILRAGTGTSRLAVWCRPTVKGASDADAFPVMSHRVPDMGAVLTSRRS